ncbi:O-antigen polymerase [Acinetobacter lwoffii]|uniref:O-antigen polymerase n=1 Tax=Acinetobacter lwoffii TaxID=28090 RepID=UPI0021CD1E56|nr:O-antigen polymerase [Acinetobacter lwoffii]MCU4420505.1 oligosaccharide repeat unit polymerase [Acinetobacter lwoffii]
MKIIYLFFLVTFILINTVFYLNSPYFYDLEFIYLLPSVLLILIYFIFKKIINRGNVDWFSIDSLFVLIFYLFHYGYLYLYFLGFQNFDSEVFWDSRYIYKSIFLLSVCCSSFLLGFFIISQNTLLNYRKVTVFNINGIYFLSKILVFLSFLFFWLPLLSVANLVFSDYKALTSVGTLSPIGKLYWVGQYIGVVSLALYYLSKTILGEKFFNDLFSLIPFFYILGYFIIGDRGGFLFYSVIPLVIYNMYYKKINIKKAAFAVFFVLICSAIIATSRVESTYNPIDAYGLAQDNKENNLLIESISEFGKSFKTLPIVMSYIPEQYDYWYGKSYFDSFMIIFPSIFDTRTSHSIAAWLTATAFGEDTYGRGGSIVMESYGNFGSIGSIFFFISLGSISGYLYNKYRFSGSLIYAVAYVAFVSSLCLWMRNSSSVVFRTVIWAILISWICVILSKYLPYRKWKKK